MSNQVKIFVVAHKPFEMLQGGLARKVKEDRIEILLGLKNDGIL